MSNETPADASWASALLDYNAWVTLELLTFCEALSVEQLVATTPGTFGTVFETLHHFVESDGHYIRRLAPELWPGDMAADADDAWGASVGGAQAFDWIRHGGPESERVERRRHAFLSGDHPRAFALLRVRAETTAALWQTYLRTDPDPFVMVTVPKWSRESAPAVLVAMALGHAHEHREQVFAILTSVGIELPDLGAVGWGRTRGFVRPLG